jgi:hypothetical protein
MWRRSSCHRSRPHRRPGRWSRTGIPCRRRRAAAGNRERFAVTANSTATRCGAAGGAVTPPTAISPFARHPHEPLVEGLKSTSPLSRYVASTRGSTRELKPAENSGGLTLARAAASASPSTRQAVDPEPRWLWPRARRLRPTPPLGRCPRGAWTEPISPWAGTPFHETPHSPMTHSGHWDSGGG